MNTKKWQRLGLNQRSTDMSLWLASLSLLDYSTAEYLNLPPANPQGATSVGKYVYFRLIIKKGHIF